MAAWAVPRIACIALLALPLTWLTTGEAAATTHQKARTKYESTAKLKPQAKNAARKSLARKPGQLHHPAVKAHPGRKNLKNHRRQAIARKPAARTAAARRPPARKPATAMPIRPMTAKPAAVPVERKIAATNAPQAVTTAVAHTESSLVPPGATTLCKREGRIYLLADCERPLPTPLGAPIDGALRQLP